MSDHQPQALYRFYDATGVLLYVGITADPGARWRKHAHEKPWWQEVVKVTLEQLPDRGSVVRAEEAAIKTEHPRYNVVHNRVSRRAPSSAPAPATSHLPYTTDANLWTYRSHRSGLERTTDLYLDWYVDGSAITDEWTPDEITASSLLSTWLKRYGAPAVELYWSIAPVHETAPFQPHIPWQDGRSFLTYFTWPRSAHTGERLNFNRLPVLDQAWNDGYADKGGFIQQATGWKPAPLQGELHVRAVLAAAGINVPPFTTEGAPE